MKPRAFALPIALFVLVGCSSTVPSAAQGASPAAVISSASAGDLPSTDSHGTLPDADWISLVRDDDGTFYDAVPADLIVRDAKMMCGVFNPSKGGDPQVQFAMATKVGMALGMTAREAGGFLVYATSQYCTKDYRLLPSA